MQRLVFLALDGGSIDRSVFLACQLPTILPLTLVAFTIQWDLECCLESADGQIIYDWESAIQLYERKTKQGSVIAMTSMGVFYLQGWGVRQNGPRGVALVRRAAETGYARALFCLAMTYYHGSHGESQDFGKAVELFQRGAAGS